MLYEKTNGFTKHDKDIIVNVYVRVNMHSIGLDRNVHKRRKPTKWEYGCWWNEKKKAAGNLSKESEREKWLPCHILFDRHDRHPFSDYANSMKEKRKDRISL